MLSVSVTSTKNIANATKKMQKALKKVPQQAIQEFKDLTPVKSGNARRNTRLNNNIIEAEYDYAVVLDRGRHMTTRGMRGSTQAPQGMTKPFYKWLKEKFRSILGK